MSSISGIPRISTVVREDHLVEDSIRVIRVIRPEWIEARDKHGDVIKSKVNSSRTTFPFRVLSPAHLFFLLCISTYASKNEAILISCKYIFLIVLNICLANVWHS